jgi:hypothetical protein
LQDDELSPADVIEVKYSGASQDMQEAERLFNECSGMAGRSQNLLVPGNEFLSRERIEENVIYPTFTPGVYHIGGELTLYTSVPLSAYDFDSALTCAETYLSKVTKKLGPATT